MHKITDQIKLLMVQKNHQKGEMRGKIGETFEYGKKNEGEINQMMGGGEKNQLSYLISSSYCNLRYLSLHQ